MFQKISFSCLIHINVQMFMFMCCSNYYWIGYLSNIALILVMILKVISISISRIFLKFDHMLKNVSQEVSNLNQDIRSKYKCTFEKMYLTQFNFHVTNFMNQKYGSNLMYGKFIN